MPRFTQLVLGLGSRRKPTQLHGRGNLHSRKHTRTKHGDDDDSLEILHHDDQVRVEKAHLPEEGQRVGRAMGGGGQEEQRIQPTDVETGEVWLAWK